jgi:hypothetical protein
MGIQPLVALLIVTILPIAWIASEFGNRPALRVVLGLATITSAMGVAYLVGHLSRIGYNSWYGDASKALVDTTIAEIEDGNMDRVMSALRRHAEDD